MGRKDRRRDRRRRDHLYGERCAKSGGCSGLYVDPVGNRSGYGEDRNPGSRGDLAEPTLRDLVHCEKQLAGERPLSGQRHKRSSTGATYLGGATEGQGVAAAVE